jgi:hypothetical protein
MPDYQFGLKPILVKAINYPGLKTGAIETNQKRALAQYFLQTLCLKF